jgi:hypothetical protein
MIPYLFLLLSVASSGTAGPAAEYLVERFCAVYLTQSEYGLLEGANRRVMVPFLSKRLLRQLDAAYACQQDWYRKLPKGSTDKPPFVDCCLFSGMPDGMPTSYKLGAHEALSDGRIKVVISFARKTTMDEIRWRDAAIVTREGGRYVIDDFLYDIDAEPPGRPILLSHEFDSDCKNGLWVHPM